MAVSFRQGESMKKSQRKGLFKTVPILDHFNFICTIKKNKNNYEFMTLTEPTWQ